MSKEELLGKPFIDFIPETDRDNVLQSIKALDAGNPSQTYLHQSIITGNIVVWQEWTDTVLLDENGQVTEIQSYGKDVTDRVNAENERELRLKICLYAPYGRIWKASDKYCSENSG